MRRGFVLLVVTACGRIDFDPVTAMTRDGAPDGDAPGTADACALGPFGPVTSLGPTVNSVSHEYGPTLSADGLTIVFHSDRVGGMGVNDLYMSTRASTADPFGVASALTTLNSTSDEDSPWLSGDGLTLYFSSTRAAVSKRLYVTTRATTASPWAAPALVPGFASEEVSGVALGPDGNEMFYNHESGGVLMMRGTLVPPTVLGPVTELNQGGDGYPSLSSDGLTIYWERDLAGTDDVYTATRPTVGAAFANLAVVSTSLPGLNDDDPEISRDGQTLVFASDRPGGVGLFDLYMATRSCP